MDEYTSTSLMYAVAGVTTVFSVVIGTLVFLILQSRRMVVNIAHGQSNTDTSEQRDEGAQGDRDVQEGESETDDIDNCIVDPKDIEPVTEPEATHPATVDPLEYSEHIQGKVKQAKAKYITKQIEKKMTANQIAEEREVQRRQLEAIFNLMKQSENKFGTSSMEDIDEQFKLYA
ncbi:matrix-remodeling-associated protein 7-like [Ptychodera flava]|uniref:matrix-remodeling-associated protein 7-like n=1 Tax=Ptychodera flava TaxID=63121 RepID=UPI003969C574